MARVMKPVQSPTMAAYIFWRVFPLAVLVLSIFGYSLHHVVIKSAQDELSVSLAWQNRLAVDLFEQRLTSISQQVQTIAENRFVREFLNPTSFQQLDISTYFSTIEIAGAPRGRVMLVSPEGRVLASNSEHASLEHTKDHWQQTQYFARNVFHLDENGLLIAVPVMVRGLPQGSVIFEYSINDLSAIFDIQSVRTPLALVSADGLVVYASNPMISGVISQAYKTGHVKEGWAVSWLPTELNRHIRIYVAEPAPLSLSHIGQVRHYLMVTFLVTMLALLGGVALTAWMGTRDLALLSEVVGRITSSDDLDQRIKVSGPLELQSLGQRFNDMLAALKRTTLSREYFDNVIRSLREILIVVHPDGHILTVNMAAVTFLRERGLSEESNIRDIVAASSLNPKGVEDFLSSDSAENALELHYEIDGDGLYLSWTRTTMTGPNDSVTGIIYSARDITASRIAERARLESEERLNLAVSGTHDGVWDWKIRDNHIYYAPRVLELLRLPEDQVFAPVPDSLFDLLHRDDEPRLRKRLENHLAGQGDFSVECRLMCGDGDYRWFLIRGEAINDSDGKPIRMAGSISDITVRKEHEMKLARFQITMEGSHDMITMISPTQLTFAYVNEGAVRTLGYSREELREMSPWDLQLNTTKREYLHFIRPLLTGGQDFRSFETRYLCKDGTELDVEMLLQVVRHDDGTVMLVGIGRDITERRKIDRMKSEFISTVSHELRTPLTSIMGSMGLIRGGAFGDVAPELTSMIDVAYKNSERLVALINDILDIEKIESGRMTFAMDELDVMELIETAVQQNKGYADRFGVRLNIAGRVKNATVHGDSMRLLQVLANLLSNAVKFSPEGGTVDLSARRYKGRIRISVADKGPGIPKDFEDRIFSKFAQADSSDTRAVGGTGLGLSICKAIVEKHAGIIDYRSKPGKGTTFYFELPEILSDKPKSNTPSGPQKTTGQKKRAGKKPRQVDSVASSTSIHESKQVGNSA